MFRLFCIYVVLSLLCLLNCGCQFFGQFFTLITVERLRSLEEFNSSELDKLREDFFGYIEFIGKNIKTFSIDEKHISSKIKTTYANNKANKREIKETDFEDKEVEFEWLVIPEMYWLGFVDKKIEEGIVRYFDGFNYRRDLSSVKIKNMNKVSTGDQFKGYSGNNEVFEEYLFEEPFLKIKAKSDVDEKKYIYVKNYLNQCFEIYTSDEKDSVIKQKFVVTSHNKVYFCDNDRICLVSSDFYRNYFSFILTKFQEIINIYVVEKFCKTKGDFTKFYLSILRENELFNSGSESHIITSEELVASGRRIGRNVSEVRIFKHYGRTFYYKHFFHLALPYGRYKAGCSNEFSGTVNEESDPYDIIRKWLFRVGSDKKKDNEAIRGIAENLIKKIGPNYDITQSIDNVCKNIDLAKLGDVENTEELFKNKYLKDLQSVMSEIGIDIKDVIDSNLEHYKKVESIGLIDYKEVGNIIKEVINAIKALRYLAGKIYAVEYALIPCGDPNKYDIHLRGGHELTSRNVLSSKLARFLGLSDIIVDADFIQLTNEEQKNSTGQKSQTCGVFLEEARGKLRIKDAYKLLKKNNDSVKYNYDVIRDLTTLWIFDFICGQIDRHNENIMINIKDKAGNYVCYDTEKDDIYTFVYKNGEGQKINELKFDWNSAYMCDVTGIDNDIAFGCINNDFNQVSLLKNPTKEIIISNNTFNMIKFISEEFYNIIQSFDFDKFKKIIPSVKVKFDACTNNYFPRDEDQFKKCAEWCEARFNYLKNWLKCMKDQNKLVFVGEKTTKKTKKEMCQYLCGYMEKDFMP